MSRPSSTAVPESTDRRGVQIALWVLRGLLALVFLQSGLEKFAGAEQSVQTFDEIGLGDWFRYTVGTIEMVGAIGLLVGRTAAAAAVALAVTMVGAVITQVTVVDDGGFVVPLIFGIMAGTIAWVRRRDLLALATEARDRFASAR
jgi:uncharacterized membrane protein YphA (DoxX/SURF4 family)